VAQRVLDAGDVRRKAGVVLPGARLRHDHVAAEAAVDIDPEDPRVRTYVLLIVPALVAMAANPVRFAAHEVSRLQRDHVFADLDDLAGKLMAHDPWWLHPLRGPRVPVVYMEVGSADRGREDLYKYVVGACDVGFGN